MKDSLDRELHVGDQIVYCTRAGSSMDLIYARVLEAEDARVRVQPLNTHRGPFVYVDSRTGEDISWKEIEDHVVQESGYYSKLSGEKIPTDYVQRLPWDSPRRKDFEMRGRKFADYVTSRRDPANPVYLRASYYIAKLEPLVEQDTFVWVEKNS